jgi:hypothetical protein
MRPPNGGQARQESVGPRIFVISRLVSLEQHQTADHERGA